MNFRQAHSNADTNGGRKTRPGGGALKAKIHQKLLESLNLREARRMSPGELREECRWKAEDLLRAEQCPLTEGEKEQLLRDVMDDIFGLGPLEQLMRDPKISDILVNGYSKVYIERDGRLEPTNVQFRDNNHVLQVIQRIAAQVGRRIDENSPMLDARLLDGSRVNAIIPPLALQGPAVSIRRFGTVKLDIEELIERDTLTREMAVFMKACIAAKMNVLISGGTGSGKTTLLNVVSGWIPSDERLVTIEDAAELQLQRSHVVPLETRPANIEGKGEVTQRDLLRNSLRMRPDRIIIGEVRGAEALDMLQAMNTGHEGSLTTVHANSPRDALRRVENMVSMAGLDYPVRVIRDQMASALNLLVHLDRVTGGSRKVIKIAEITGTENDVICLQDIFQFVQTGVDESGCATGHFEACGTCPMLLKKLQAAGAHLPDGLFRRRVLAGASSSAERR